MQAITQFAEPLDARPPTDPTEYDADVIHPRVNRAGFCVTCHRPATDACEWPYLPDPADGFVDNELIDVIFGGTR